MRCKMCNRNYHHCTNCDSGGIPWEADGYCSGDCYYDWSQEEIERLTTESGYWERIARRQIGENEQLTREITRLRGVCNLLADKLSIYTGYPIPTEVREAESAEAAGADRWNPFSYCYVDEDGNEAVGGEQ